MERDERENADDREDVGQRYIVLGDDTEHRRNEDEEREDENFEIVDDIEKFIWG